MPRIAPAGVRHSPSVLSASAPGTFLRDAGRGLLWLLGRTAEMLQGKRRLSARALGREGDPEGGGEPPSMH